MANEIRGEFPLTVGGRTYRLVFGIDELCEAEALLGETIGEFYPKLAALSVRVSRALLIAALRKYHDRMTEAEVAALYVAMIDEVGLIGISETMRKGVALAFPARKEATEEGARPTPRPKRSRRAKATPKA